MNAKKTMPHGSTFALRGADMSNATPAASKTCNIGNPHVKSVREGLRNGITSLYPAARNWGKSCAKNKIAAIEMIDQYPIEIPRRHNGNELVDMWFSLLTYKRTVKHYGNPSVFLAR